MARTRIERWAFADEFSRESLRRWYVAGIYVIAPSDSEREQSHRTHVGCRAASSVPELLRLSVVVSRWYPSVIDGIVVVCALRVACTAARSASETAAMSSSMHAHLGRCDGWPVQSRFSRFGGSARIRPLDARTRSGGDTSSLMNAS